MYVMKVLLLHACKLPIDLEDNPELYLVAALVLCQIALLSLLSSCLQCDNFSYYDFLLMFCS